VRVALEMVCPDYTLFVAELDGNLCGYACIGPTPFTLATWHLYWIAVHPKVQGRGVGRAIQAYVEQHVIASNGQRLVVETSGRPDYLRSRRFYEASGYSAAGRIADYYKPGDDCVFYCKVL